MMMTARMARQWPVWIILLGLSLGHAAMAQNGPSAAEIAGYEGLHAAAARGDVATIERLVRQGAVLNGRDAYNRTPLIVATFERKHLAASALIAAGANINALENSRYDMLTIATVADDYQMVQLAIRAGADAGLVTSPYDGTALIASAHLGHVAIVRELIAAGAPLDHVNNLGWTALIEAIVLGDGGYDHTSIVGDLIAAGADVNLADGNSTNPLTLARQRGYAAIITFVGKGGREAVICWIRLR
jgi:ankyrin repeat protein